MVRGQHMLRRLTRIFAATLALIVIGAWSASALWVSRTGAQAWTNVDSTWNWVNKYEATGIRLDIRDTACDDHGVYTYFRVDSDSDFNTTARWNKKGCNTADTYEDLWIDAYPGQLYGVTFYVCVSGVSCTASARWDNPRN